MIEIRCVRHGKGILRSPILLARAERVPHNSRLHSLGGAKYPRKLWVLGIRRKEGGRVFDFEETSSTVVQIVVDRSGKALLVIVLCDLCRVTQTGSFRTGLARKVGQPRLLPLDGLCGLFINYERPGRMACAGYLDEPVDIGCPRCNLTPVERHERYPVTIELLAHPSPYPDRRSRFVSRKKRDVRNDRPSDSPAQTSDNRWLRVWVLYFTRCRYNAKIHYSTRAVPRYKICHDTQRLTARGYRSFGSQCLCQDHRDGCPRVLVS